MSIFFIAEIGINHNGDMKICKQLIDLAVVAGCDAVKFQKRDIESVYNKEFLDGFRESPWGTTQREQKYGLEFDSAIQHNNIYGAQFHPEKSHKHGMKLLENFSKISSNLYM